MEIYIFTASSCTFRQLMEFYIFTTSSCISCTFRQLMEFYIEYLAPRGLFEPLYIVYEGKSVRHAL